MGGILAEFEGDAGISVIASCYVYVTFLVLQQNFHTLSLKIPRAFLVMLAGRRQLGEGAEKSLSSH